MSEDILYAVDTYIELIERGRAHFDSQLRGRVIDQLAVMITMCAAHIATLSRETSEDPTSSEVLVNSDPICF